MQVDIGCLGMLYSGSKDQHKTVLSPRRVSGLQEQPLHPLVLFFRLSDFQAPAWPQWEGEQCSTYTDKSSVKREILFVVVPIWLGRSPVCIDTKVVQLHIPREFTSRAALPFKYRHDDWTLWCAIICFVFLIVPALGSEQFGVCILNQTLMKPFYSTNGYFPSLLHIISAIRLRFYWMYTLTYLKNTRANVAPICLPAGS